MFIEISLVQIPWDFFPKKIIAMMICFAVTLSLVGCGTSARANVNIDYGTSSIYTEEDMNAAIEKGYYIGCSLIIGLGSYQLLCRRYKK